MQVTPPPDVSQIVELWPMLKDLLTIVIIPYLAWNFKINKELNDKIDDIKIDVKAVNTTLIGQDGKNGLRSRFNQMERQVANIMLSLARSGMTIRIEDIKESGDE